MNDKISLVLFLSFFFNAQLFNAAIQGTQNSENQELLTRINGLDLTEKTQMCCLIGLFYALSVKKDTGEEWPLNGDSRVIFCIDSFISVGISINQINALQIIHQILEIIASSISSPKFINEIRDLDEKTMKIYPFNFTIDGEIEDQIIWLCGNSELFPAYEIYNKIKFAFPNLRKELLCSYLKKIPRKYNSNAAHKKQNINYNASDLYRELLVPYTTSEIIEYVKRIYFSASQIVRPSTSLWKVFPSEKIAQSLDALDSKKEDTPIDSITINLILAQFKEIYPLLRCMFLPDTSFRNHFWLLKNKKYSRTLQQKRYPKDLIQRIQSCLNFFVSFLSDKNQSNNYFDNFMITFLNFYKRMPQETRIAPSNNYE